jgi:TonB family protein
VIVMVTELVNHLWQSTLVVAAIAALAAMLRDDGAHARYWLWWAASVKFLVPFSLLTMLGSALGEAGAPRLELADWPATLDTLAQPMPATTSVTPIALTLLGVWALGFAAVVGAWAARALQVRSLLRASAPCTASLPRVADGLEVRTAKGLLEPALVGVVRPVLLLPRGIAEHLSEAQLAAVLEHELAHWRRRDNLTAAAHMLVEAVFWFHPLVWWIGARLVEERERACDEAVVRAGHDGRTYAEGILNVCERYVASALKCAAGISGADLKRRVIEIARSRVMSELSIEKKTLLGTFALCTLLVPIIFGAAAQGNDAPRPVVRINPEYPADALAAGREGEVELEFTIAVDGKTKDIVVVASSSPEFENPAVVALTKWKYLPTNVECDGSVCTPIANLEALERPGVRTVMRWQLEPDWQAQAFEAELRRLREAEAQRRNAEASAR